MATARRNPYGRARTWLSTFANERRRAWVQCPEIETVLTIGQFVHPDDPDPQPHEAVLGGYEPVKLHFRKGKYGVTIDLTLMTVEEITAMKTIIDLAIEKGLEVSEKLDAQAQDIFDSGEVSVPMRAFRMKPALIVRHLHIKGIDS